MGPKDSFGGALTWLLHYGDREPLAEYIRTHGIQRGTEADTLSQLLTDAHFKLGRITSHEDDLLLEALKIEWRSRESIKQMSKLLNDAHHRLAQATSNEDHLTLEALEQDWKRREALIQMGRKDFPRRFIEERLRQARPDLKRRALQKEIDRHVQQFKRWRRGG